MPAGYSEGSQPYSRKEEGKILGRDGPPVNDAKNVYAEKCTPVGPGIQR